MEKYLKYINRYYLGLHFLLSNNSTIWLQKDQNKLTKNKIGIFTFNIKGINENGIISFLPYYDHGWWRATINKHHTLWCPFRHYLCMIFSKFMTYGKQESWHCKSFNFLKLIEMLYIYIYIYIYIYSAL